MQVDQVNIVVADVAATAAFFEQLGFAVPAYDPAWDLEHRTVTVPGGADIDIDSVGFARWWGGVESPCVVVNVRCASRDEVDERYAALVAAGHVGQKAPWDAFWGARYAVVAAPGGTAIGLMSGIDPDRRSQAPEPPF